MAGLLPRTPPGAPPGWPPRLVLLLLLAGVWPGPLRAFEVDWRRLEGLARGKVESCGGWRLNRLKEVKAFITEDLPLYHNLVMKHLAGADPELVLLSSGYRELERIPLSDMTREEINHLVQELGFYRKETPDGPVPEEFQQAPAKPWPASEEAKKNPRPEEKGATGEEL